MIYRQSSTVADDEVDTNRVRIDMIIQNRDISLGNFASEWHAIEEVEDTLENWRIRSLYRAKS